MWILCEKNKAWPESDFIVTKDLIYEQGNKNVLILFKI